MSDKYKNGKIYTIRCKNDNTLIYVGSTVQPLFKRWHQHKSNINNTNDNMLLYKKMRETNIEDWYIELYEEFSCENKEQLNKREGQIIREIGTLNKRIEGRTPKEYRDSNKELISEKKKIYNKNNKEIISEKKKEYREKNKDKLLAQMKEYYKANKDNLLAQMKEYRQKQQYNNF